jgi:ubiquinone/menaquinone biosynthesis C-methylase UbiE
MGKAAFSFDEPGARRIEAIYLSTDVAAQRARVVEALALEPGDRVADLGCGPGLLALELAGRVGEAGAVECIDSSESMVALARGRCAQQACVSVNAGDVSMLPYDNGVFDAAVCTQVYEYVPAVDRALQELLRVLRPGGRAVVVDSDWESCVWDSGDRARMHRILDLWDTHCPHPRLPRALTPMLESAGFVDVEVDVIPLVNARYDPQTYSYQMIGVISKYAAKLLDASEAQAWAEDLHAHGRDGRYFFSLNRYMFRCRKPGESG